MIDGLDVLHIEKQNRRRSIRLPGYDYSQPGTYFVTICTYQRICLFGDVVLDTVNLNGMGLTVRDEWLRTAEIRGNVQLDTYQIMPNHLHAIVMIAEQSTGGGTVGAHGCAPSIRQPRSLGSLIAGFKSAATKRINQIRRTPGVAVWQRNYYERVIRNEQDLDTVRRYIEENPAKWAEDSENPRNSRR